jgi:hypothetical protein
MWVRRWFLLDGTTLCFIKNANDLEPQAVCDVMLATVRNVNADAGDPQYAFEIFSANRTSQMLQVRPLPCLSSTRAHGACEISGAVGAQATGPRDLEEWTTAIRTCIERKLVKGESRSRGSSFSEASNETGATAMSHSAAKRPSVTSAFGLHRRPSMVTPTKSLVESLRLLSGNDKCADCGQQTPDWVSINHGVLLCIECSGIHRSLGSHISKVFRLLVSRTRRGRG